MKFKIWKIICVFIIFLLSLLFHYLYEIYPSFITSIFSAVNESIWEHNKIIISPFICLAIIEKIHFKNTKNVIFTEFISMLYCIIITIMLFTPIYFYVLNYKHNMIITLSIFIFAIIISQLISYNLFKSNYNKKLEYISILAWIILLIINTLLTYYPPSFKLFYDFSKNIYGLYN